MKEAVILILSILVCYLLWRLFSIKYTLKKAEKELREISAEPEENRIVKFPVPDKTMEAFLCAVNENLEEIRKLRIAYAKKEENLKEEIENISHDLRTPLTAILGYLKMMDTSSMSREEQESLKIVRKKSEELQKLIGQFYELSRVSDGNFQMKLEETDAGRILRECCLSHYGLLEKLKVELFIPEMPVKIRGNQEALTRVFVNLLQNSVRYGQTELTVFAENKENEAVFIFENDIEEGTELSDPSRLFDRFYMQEASRTKGGTGLGLTVSKYLVEYMNGKIWAEYKKTGQKTYLQITIGFPLIFF